MKIRTHRLSSAIRRPSSWLCGVHDDESLLRCEEKYISSSARPIIIFAPFQVEGPCPSPRVSHLLRDVNRHQFEVFSVSLFILVQWQTAPYKPPAPAPNSGPCFPSLRCAPSWHSPPGISEWTANSRFLVWVNIHLHVKYSVEKKKTATSKMTVSSACAVRRHHGRFMSD